MYIDYSTVIGISDICPVQFWTAIWSLICLVFSQVWRCSHLWPWFSITLWRSSTDLIHPKLCWRTQVNAYSKKNACKHFNKIKWNVWWTPKQTFETWIICGNWCSDCCSFDCSHFSTLESTHGPLYTFFCFVCVKQPLRLVGWDMCAHRKLPPCCHSSFALGEMLIKLVWFKRQNILNFWNKRLFIFST